jgi:hypothetical protein
MDISGLFWQLLGACSGAVRAARLVPFPVSVRVSPDFSIGFRSPTAASTDRATLTVRPSVFMLCSDMADGTTSPAASRPDDAKCGDGEGACARPVAEQQIGALGELIGIGLKIARAIERQVDEVAGGPSSLADLNAAAIAYARVARAVRQSILLQTKLSEERRATGSKAAGLRSRAARIVRRVIEAEHRDAEQVERLAAEAAERLEQEFQDEALSRPVAEIIAGVCKDLGLKPDWRGLIDDISALEAFANGDVDDAPPEPERLKIFWLDADGRPAPAPARPKRNSS